jgi:transposase-like protein
VKSRCVRSTRESSSWRPFGRYGQVRPLQWWLRYWAYPRQAWAIGCGCQPRESWTVLAAQTRSAKVSPEQMEIARLRAEVARLRMERDIAKKAAAYFAQDTLRGTPGFKK